MAVTVIGEVTTTGSTAKAASATAAAHAPGGGGVTFGEVLRCLNPLQYLPVVGTIYRAVTGDTIPTGMREVGGLAFSALTGGPVGLALTAATDVAERATGIDEDAIGQRVLHWLGIGGGASGGGVGVVGADARASGPGAAGGCAVAFAGTFAGPFTGTELARAAGAGADGLNGLELQRLAAVGASAYRQSAALR